MKKYVLLFSLMIIGSYNFAQSKPKPSKPAEQAPTQKEMETLMKEAMKGLSAEDQKRMEQMGIKMPNFKDIPKTSDKALQAAWEEETRLVPLRDAGRIASIAKGVTDAKTRSYVAAIHQKYTAKLDKEIIEVGNLAYEWTKQNKLSGYKAGNVALAFWLKGKPQTALYIMGKICSAEDDLDNLSNYAAMMSMLGGEHLAIPLLNSLNTKFPKNSTLLNNLGQAWLGLGEISKAEKYLDSAIRLNGYHPQANFSKSFIEESKGNEGNAVHLVRNAIHNNYSEEKEERLHKLGYDLQYEDVHFPFKANPDPLGFGNSKHPEFPKNAQQEVGLKEVWADYRNMIDEKLAALSNQARVAQEVMAQKAKERLALVQSISMQSMAAGRPVASINIIPVFMKKGTLKLKELEKPGGPKTVLDNKLKHWASFWQEQYVGLKKQYEADMAKIAAEDLEQTGEGKPNKDYCEEYMNRVTQHLNICNSDLENRTRSYLAAYKLFYGQQLYWLQFAQWPEQFEVTKLTYQVNWLATLRDLKYVETGYFDNRELCVREEDDPEPDSSKLANFDDVACQYKSVMNLGVMKFTNNCSQMISEFDVKFFQYKREDDFNRAEGDTYLKSTLKFAVEQGYDGAKIDVGPLKAEAKIGAGLEIELDRNGLKDVIFSVEAKTGLGTNVLDDGLEKGGSVMGKDMVDTTVEIGIEAKASIISGKGSVKGSGKLENITVLEW